MTRLRTYSIRGLLFAVTVAGAGCGWGARELREYEQRIAASAALQGDVCIADTTELPWYVVAVYRWRGRDEPRCYANRLIVRPSVDVTDEKLSYIARLPELTHLSFHGRMLITDVGLQQLETLHQLRVLNLRDAPVTAAAVERLKRALPECEVRWRPKTAPATATEPSAKVE